MDVKDIKLELPTHTIIVGGTKSGKTTLLANLMRTHIRHADYIVLFSATLRLHNQYECLKSKPLIQRETVDLQLLRRFLAIQKKLAQLYKDGGISRPIRAFLIMDDNNAFSLYKQHGKGPLDSLAIFNELFKQARHYYVSCFLLSQCSSGQIPKQLRENSPYIFVTQVNNGLIDSTFQSTLSPSRSDYRNYMITSCVPRRSGVLISAENIQCPVMVTYHAISAMSAI